MAESGDLIKEFKEAKPPEKAVIVGGIIAVIAIAWYWHMKTSGGSATPAQGSTSNSPQSGFPTVGPNSTPVLPAGVNPVYDPSGNLVAFQGGGSPGGQPGPQGPPGPPGSAAHPQNWFTNLLGKVGYGTHVYAGGYDANGQRFYAGSNSNMFYAPVGSQIVNGGQGRIWITPPGGTQQLLTGPGSSQFAHPGPGVNKQLTQAAKTAASVRH